MSSLFTNPATANAPTGSGSLGGSGGGGGGKKNRGVKRKRPGYGSDSGRYIFAKPDFHQWHTQFATPQGSLNGEVVLIEIELADNQIARVSDLLLPLLLLPLLLTVLSIYHFQFKDDPFQIDAHIRWPNPIFSQVAWDANVANGTPQTDDNVQKLRRVNPIDHSPAVYVDEFVEGQFLFAKCSVSLDNKPIPNGNLEELGFHWRVLNRALATNGLRKEKYGKSYTGIANSRERVTRPATAATAAIPATPAIRIPTFDDANPAQANSAATVVVPRVANARAYVAPVPRYTHPNVERAMRMFSYTDLYANNDTVQPASIALGFDHVWPLASSSNVLLTLTGQYNGNGEKKGCCCKAILL